MLLWVLLLPQGAATGWPAFQLWDWPYLLQRWGAVEFQCEASRLTLAEYGGESGKMMAGCRQRDDKPLYLFDKEFMGTPQGAEQMAAHGSRFHVDPNATDAWNACIRGRKRWIMYPPGVPPPGVIPSDDRADVASPVSLVEWFASYYHRKNANGAEPLEVTVEPGDVLSFFRDSPHCISGLAGSDNLGHPARAPDLAIEPQRDSSHHPIEALRREEPAMLDEAEEAPDERKGHTV
eukprot:gene32174-37447_t